MQPTPATAERTYNAYYKNKEITVNATSSYDAQLLAAKQFKAKKSYEVAIVLADVPVSTASF